MKVRVQVRVISDYQVDVETDDVENRHDLESKAREQVVREYGLSAEDQVEICDLEVVR